MLKESLSTFEKEGRTTQPVSLICLSREVGRLPSLDPGWTVELWLVADVQAIASHRAGTPVTHFSVGPAYSHDLLAGFQAPGTGHWILLLSTTSWWHWKCFLASASLGVQAAKQTSLVGRGFWKAGVQGKHGQCWISQLIFPA